MEHEEMAAAIHELSSFAETTGRVLKNHKDQPQRIFLPIAF